MDIREATSKRIEEIRKEKRLSKYALAYEAEMPSSTLKSIINGKSGNPGICTIRKIADGLGMTFREFFDSELFEHLDQID